MSTPDEPLAAALHTSLFGELCIAEVTFDRECEADDHIEDAKAVSAALTADGWSIVRSDELAGLRAVAAEAERYHEAASGGHLPWDRHVALEDALRGLRSGLEGVSR